MRVVEEWWMIGFGKWLMIGVEEWWMVGMQG